MSRMKKRDYEQALEQLQVRLNDLMQLSPVDLDARSRYQDYGRARDEMFRATHSPRAPWTVVSFNDQRRGRLNLMRHLLDHTPYERIVDEPLALTPLTTVPAKEQFSGPVKPIRGWY
ncbi:MAG: hypothetical protein Q8O42_10805 [Acidobacteriota bacterium]|nr:hypothetical protein [Acidobacteriota bacterium]